MRRQQLTPMTHCPAFGTPLEEHHPKVATEWRERYGALAWLYSPWGGSKRHPSDVGLDTFGVLLIPPGEPIQVSEWLMEDSGPYHDPAHPERLLPVKYYTEPASEGQFCAVTYAVHGTSSITYVDRLREQVASLREQLEKERA